MKITKSWYMYVVKCSDSTLYTGVTTDISRRLSEHNSGKRGAKYTRSRLPVSLVYWDEHPDRSTAQRYEAAFKRLSRARKVEIISERVMTLMNDGSLGYIRGFPDQLLFDFTPTNDKNKGG